MQTGEIIAEEEEVKQCPDCESEIRIRNTQNFDGLIVRTIACVNKDCKFRAKEEFELARTRREEMV